MSRIMIELPGPWISDVRSCDIEESPTSPPAPSSTPKPPNEVHRHEYSLSCFTSRSAFIVGRCYLRTMNAAFGPSILDSISEVPSDPILGVTEAFALDSNPRKVNLGQGLYYGEDGRIPLLQCVRQAERQYLDSPSPRGYLPSDGLASYGSLVRKLIFGTDAGRIVTLQAVGGTGGLKVGADFLKRATPKASVWISDPSWENHRQLFRAAGFPVKTYAYYHAASHGLDFDAMRTSLEAARAGDIVVLHGCCHNPTGVDLKREHWQALVAQISARRLIPFIDLAYQGFGDGLEEDAYAARVFLESMAPVIVANSFSKSFSLYGERVGALSIVTADDAQAARVRSNLKQLVRTNYSNPPTHGATLIATVLASPELRSLWETELGGMRERIKKMRAELVGRIGERVQCADFRFVLEQRGMFSYSGMTRDQVRRLREKYSVHAIDSGRLCIPALNPGNVDYVAAAIADVIT
jgi:aromatic-amino-acid transaminase